MFLRCAVICLALVICGATLAAPPVRVAVVGGSEASALAAELCPQLASAVCAASADDMLAQLNILVPAPNAAATPLRALRSSVPKGAIWALSRESTEALTVARENNDWLWLCRGDCRWDQVAAGIVARLNAPCTANGAGGTWKCFE